MAEKSPDTWRSTIRRRMAVAAVMLAAWCLVIAWRLVDLQVVQRQSLMDGPYTARSVSQTIPARRGDLLDRNGMLMASTVELPSIYAIPREVEDVPKAVEMLCDALGDGDCDEPEFRRTLADRLSRKTAPRRVVKRGAELAEAHRVLDLKLPWIEVVLENQRYYPHREAAAHVLGSVGPDQALGGIEAKYDTLLKGRAGTLSLQKDGKGGTFGRQVETAPVAGVSIELTIHLPLQMLAERELKRGVDENHAAGGSVVVMDPSSGEVLVMAAYPTFNPNPVTPRRGDVRNPVVEDTYEPGSTMKSVTASVALEEHVVTPDELIDVSSGKIAFGKSGTDVVTDSHRYDTLSFTNVIAMSSNVGTIKVAAKIGGDRLADYIRRFGFGRLTSGDFLGEAKGLVPGARALRNDAALARAAIGYTMSVTPLQMAAAISSIANGGELVQPRVVRAFIQDGVRDVVKRKVLHRTVSRETAVAVTAIMEEVVENGTGASAKIPGYTVAAKTGTAEKRIGREYSKTENHASLALFVPSRAPEFTVVVVIDTPRGPNGRFGGPVAGPVARRIAEGALRMAAVPPTVNPPSPLLVRRDAEGVRERLTSGSTTTPPTTLDAIGRRPGADGRLPDLTGMSVRSALGTLSRLGATPHAIGSGVVVDQRPRAGTPLEAGTAVTLWLSRRRPVEPIVNGVGP